MEIRDATFKDIPKIVKLLEGANDEFGCASVPFCKDTTRNTIQRVISHQNHACFILVDGDTIKGILAGLINQLWYSKKRHATDLIFYVAEDTRGHGAKLLTTYMSWARNQPNVVEISLGITSGFKETDRVERLLEAVGMKKVGGNFMLHPDEEDESWVA